MKTVSRMRSSTACATAWAGTPRKETSYLKNLGLPGDPLLGVATKHCDGSPLLPADPG